MLVKNVGLKDAFAFDFWLWHHLAVRISCVVKISVILFNNNMLLCLYRYREAFENPQGIGHMALMEAKT